MLLEGRGASYKMPSKYVHIKYCWAGNWVKKDYKQIFIFSPYFEEIFMTGEWELTRIRVNWGLELWFLYQRRYSIVGEHI